jgi:hypothetical protein
MSVARSISRSVHQVLLSRFVNVTLMIESWRYKNYAIFKGNIILTAVFSGYLTMLMESNKMAILWSVISN